MNAIHQFDIQVTAAHLDVNGHVNNVVYVQWMQDAAISHARATGCAQMTAAAGAMWVARTLQVEYLRPAFAGETVHAMTWVANFSRVRSLRKYKFVRAADRTVLAQGQTEWVFVEAKLAVPAPSPKQSSGSFRSSLPAPSLEPVEDL